MTTNRFLGSGNNVNDYAREQTLENIEDQLINGVTQVSISGGGSGGGDVNLIEINGNTIQAGNGVANTGVLRVAICNNNSDVSVKNGTSGALEVVSNALDLATEATLSTIETDTANIAIDINNINDVLLTDIPNLIAVPGTSHPTHTQSISGFNPFSGANTLVPLQVNSSGNLQVRSNDLDLASQITTNKINLNTQDNAFIQLMLGNNAGVGKQKIAYHDDVTNILHTIANDPVNDIPVTITTVIAGLAMSIVCTNNSLTNYDVTISYYITSSAFAVTTETLTLNGNTAVPLSNNCFRILEMKRSDTGQTGNGVVYLFETSQGSTSGVPDDAVYWNMDCEVQIDEVGIIYAPFDRNVFINNLYMSVGNISDTYEIRLAKHILPNQGDASLRNKYLLSGSSELRNLHYQLLANQTLIFQAKRIDGLVDTAVSIIIDYTIVEV